MYSVKLRKLPQSSWGNFSWRGTPEVVEKTEKITSYSYVVKNSGIVVLDTSIKMAFKLYEANIKLSNELVERKRVEEALRESEAVKNTMFSNIGDVIVIIDQNGINQYKSPNITKLFGWKPEELVGKNTWDNVHPDDLEAGQNFFGTILTESKAMGTTELRYKRKDGNYVWIEISVINLLHDKDIQGILGNYHDITERKMAEEALLASKEQLETVSDNIPGGVIYQLIVGPQGNRRLAYVSCVVERLHGVTQAEALNDARTIYDQVHEEDIQKLIKAEDQAFNTLKPFLCEARIRKPDGEIRWLQLRSAISKKPDGSIVADGIEIDITERKRAEGALRESEQRFHDLVALIPVGVYIVWIRANGHMEFEYVSDRWCAIHGLRREDVMTDIMVVNNMVHPDDRESFLDRNREAARDRKPFNWEGRFLTGDGELRQLRIESTPIVLDNGDMRWFGVTQNITERKQAEEKIQKQLTEKETLLREVHHRVKNNIATIESFLSLQAGSTANAEVKATLQDAVSRVQSMRFLYDNLLLSKELDEISIKNYVESFVDSLVMFFDPENNITIEKHIADFEVDARKAVSIGIIINELLTNVFKYAFKDRDKGTVSISIDTEEGNVTLIIQDDGVGFDERIMANKSPGFGRTIVKMLVEQLDGTYNIWNENGARSVVQFEM